MPRRQSSVPALSIGVLGSAAALATYASSGRPHGSAFVASPPPPRAAGPSAAAAAGSAGAAGRLGGEASAGTNNAALAGLAAAATAAVLGAASRAKNSRRGDGVARQASMGEIPKEMMEKLRPKWWSGKHKDLPFTFWPGLKGYRWDREYYEPPPPANRQCLSKVTEPVATFSPADFYRVPFASLKMEDIKEVSSYMTKGEEYVQGADFPQYKHPKANGTLLQQEIGDKRTAQDVEGYKAYLDAKKSLPEVAPKQGASLDKDFVADRTALHLLLSYLSEKFSGEMVKRRQLDNPLDLVKVSKVPGKKGLYLEQIFETKHTWAEAKKYNGQYRRSEMSNYGNYFPAFHRVCTGDYSTTYVTTTGKKNIAGSRYGGIPDPKFRFVEYSLGGLDFLVRTRCHMQTSAGKSVEIKTKNRGHRQESTIFENYTKILLGGTEQLTVGIQSTGRLYAVKDLTIDSLTEMQPAITDAVDRRMGRLVALLNKVKEAMASVPEGEEYVLQWQNGDLVMGKYEMPKAEEAKEAKKAKEPVEA